jgi:hypothetical protein
MVRTETITRADLVQRIVEKLHVNVPKAVAEVTAWADRLPDTVLEHLAGLETSPSDLVKIYREMRRSELNASKDPEHQRHQQEVSRIQTERVWDKFFFLHPDLKNIDGNRNPLLNRAASLSDDGVVRIQHLDEAFALLVAEGFGFARQDIKQPATAANLKQDEETLRKYCRANRRQSNTAALNMLRQQYGGAFKPSVIDQALQSGLIQLGPASDEDIVRWDAEDRAAATQARNEWLTDDTVDLTERKAAAARILADHRNQAVKAQEQRELQSAKLRDESGRSDGSTYPPLPEQITKQAIFAADGPTLRRWISEFGNYAITCRVKGIKGIQ